MISAWLCAFLSGAGVLVVEVAATRVLAPYFGQTLFVWTNVIGLVLLGLAVGSAAGGRLADRAPRPRLLATVIAIAAVWLPFAGWLAPVVADALLPAELPLDAGFEFLIQGSFVTTLICFVPPVALLGAVPPFLVRLSAASIEVVGARSGALYAASTLGSIVGTFLTSWWLLPALGSRGTFLAAGAVLLASSLPLWWMAGARATGSAAAAIAVIAGGLCALPAARAVPGGSAQGELVAAIDSVYQHVEVRRRDDLSANVLALDEGHDSFHSILPDEGYLTGGQYYDYFNLLGAAIPADGTVAIVGLAAGTHARQLLHFFPEVRLVGIELDPGVVQIGHDYLGLPHDDRLTIVAGQDGRTFLERTDQAFDLIVLDCFAAQSFVPFHLGSKECFAAARRRLTPGGLVALNVFGYAADDPVVRALVNTLNAEFPEGAVSVWLPNTRNFLVYTAADRPAPLPGELDRGLLPDPLQPVLDAVTRGMRSWRTQFDSAEVVLSDNSQALEWLQADRLRDRASALFSMGEDSP